MVIVYVLLVMDYGISATGGHCGMDFSTVCPHHGHGTAILDPANMAMNGAGEMNTIPGTMTDSCCISVFCVTADSYYVSAEPPNSLHPLYFYRGTEQDMIPAHDMPNAGHFPNTSISPRLRSTSTIIRC